MPNGPNVRVFSLTRGFSGVAIKTRFYVGNLVSQGGAGTRGLGKIPPQGEPTSPCGPLTSSGSYKVRTSPGSNQAAWALVPGFAQPICPIKSPDDKFESLHAHNTTLTRLGHGPRARAPGQKCSSARSPSPISQLGAAAQITHDALCNYDGKVALSLELSAG